MSLLRSLSYFAPRFYKDVASNGAVKVAATVFLKPLQQEHPDSHFEGDGSSHHHHYKNKKTLLRGSLHVFKVYIMGSRYSGTTL